MSKNNKEKKEKKEKKERLIRSNSFPVRPARTRRMSDDRSEYIREIYKKYLFELNMSNEPEQLGKVEQVERAERVERVKQVEQDQQVEQTEQAEKTEKTEKSEQILYSDGYPVNGFSSPGLHPYKPEKLPIYSTSDDGLLRPPPRFVQSRIRSISPGKDTGKEVTNKFLKSFS